MKPFVARYFFKDLIGESYAFVANSCLTEVLRNASRECSGEMAISRRSVWNYPRGGGPRGSSGFSVTFPWEASGLP